MKFTVVDTLLHVQGYTKNTPKCIKVRDTHEQTAVAADPPCILRKSSGLFEGKGAVEAHKGMQGNIIKSASPLMT